MPLGIGLRRASNVRLIRRRDDATQQTKRGHRSKQNRPAIALNELRAAVREGVRTRRHRKFLRMTPHIVSQLLHRGVAACRVFAQRHHHNVVEITAQAFLQALDRHFVQ